jgi:hypothetical protein
MTFKNTIMIAAAHLVLISSAANADIIVPYPQSGQQDYCSTTPGHWAGSGEVSKGSLKCYYTGDAVVSATADSTQFIMDISMQKSSGSKLCPEKESFTLPATCINNTIIIKNEDADLTGTLSNNGNNADFYNGTIIIPELGPLNVDYMHLHKQ